MKSGISLILAMFVVAIGAAGAPAPVRAADNAQITGLVDVNFGTISAIVDQSNSQTVTVCSYRGKPNRLNYSVLASGSGSGGAFTLSSGSSTLAYDVQWADSPNQAGGTMLQAGAAAPGFGNAATGSTCSQQPGTASLIVTLRAADLSSAQAGTYTGSLQLTIVPE